RAILGRDVFAAPGEPPPEADADEHRYNVTIFDLVEAMGAVLKRIADTTPRGIVLRDIPVAQCIPVILNRLEQPGRIEFTALFDNLHDRPRVIATFMALLELMRRGEVGAWQEVGVGPIILERRVPPAAPASGDEEPREEGGRT